MKILPIAVLIVWTSTGAKNMELTQPCHKISNAFNTISTSFGNSFQEIAQSAISSGNYLLTEALKERRSLLDARAIAEPKREISGIDEQKEKDVLNSFATDLKDKMYREFAVAISDLQTLALKPLLLSHDQLTQKVQQIVSSHSHQMTALLESVPADLIKFAEKSLTSQNEHISGILERLAHTASQLTQQFKPHLQNIQQHLANLGKILTTFGDILSTVTEFHHSLHLINAIQDAIQF